MPAAGADGDVVTRRGVILPLVIASPALDRVVVTADCAGVTLRRADEGKAVIRGVGLPDVVQSPALEIPALAQRAGVLATCADGGKAAIRGVALPPVVCSPALELSCGANCASVPTRADGDVAGGGRADRDLGAPQPSPYPRVGREVARGGFDPLPVRRRERKLDPAVAQQARVDPADRAACNLYRAAPQPSSYGRVGREVALARQHSRAACRLPTEFDAAIV